MLGLMLAAMLAVQTPAEAATEKAEAAAAEAGMAQARQLASSLRNASSARERALGATLPQVLAVAERRNDDIRSGEILRNSAEQASGDRLVQVLWAFAPDAASGCDAGNPCPGRREALAMLEPDNGFAWIPVLDAAVRSGDAAAVDAALARMARASRFDDYFVGSWQAWMAALEPRARSLGAKSEKEVWVRAVSYSILTPGASSVAMQCNLRRHPDASAARLEACARVGRLMSRSGTSMMTQRLGLGALRGAGVENAEDLAVRRELDWLQARMHEFATQMESRPAEMKQYFADLVATGSERRTMELALQRHGFPAAPPTDWKAPVHE